MSAELALGGRAGVQAIRGRALVGVAPGAIRLEGVAPLGAPAFVLVGSGSEATLLLPRERAVLRETSPAPILEALIGVAMGADDLRVTLTGCVVAVAAPPTGRIFDASTGAVDVAGATAFLRKERDGRWRVFAARRDGWQVEYTWSAARIPARVRLWRDEPRVDVSAVLSQVDLNVDLRPDVFHVEVPSDARPMTVDELRASGPLGGAAAGRS